MRTWRNEEQLAEKQKERHHTRLGSSAVFNITFERKLLQHVVFVVGHSSSCERRRTGVNFVERTRRDLSLWYSDSQLKNGSSVNSDHFDATDSRL